MASTRPKRPNQIDNYAVLEVPDVDAPAKQPSKRKQPPTSSEGAVAGKKRGRLPGSKGWTIAEETALLDAVDSLRPWADGLKWAQIFELYTERISKLEGSFQKRSARTIMQHWSQIKNTIKRNGPTGEANLSPFQRRVKAVLLAIDEDVDALNVDDEKNQKKDNIDDEDYVPPEVQNDADAEDDEGPDAEEEAAEELQRLAEHQPNDQSAVSAPSSSVKSEKKPAANYRQLVAAPVNKASKGKQKVATSISQMTEMMERNAGETGKNGLR